MRAHAPAATSTPATRHAWRTPSAPVLKMVVRPASAASSAPCHIADRSCHPTTAPVAIGAPLALSTSAPPELAVSLG
jgi:hypothetical protein